MFEISRPTDVLVTVGQFRFCARPLVSRSRTVAVREQQILVERILARQKLEKVTRQTKPSHDFNMKGKELTNQTWML